MAKVCQLFSGSSGNSIYIGNNENGFLVDIGVSAKRCEQGLRNIGVEPSSVKAVFVTHEHKDHVGGVRVFASRYKIPVFACPECLEELRFTGVLNNTVNSFEMKSVLDFEGTIVESFYNSHDSVSCVGYKFTLPEGRKIAVCTDTGYITDEARAALVGSTDLVFLEANHEISMLENGGYPYILKKRILSPNGHLSNYACGEFAKELVKNGTTRLVLSHLSRENNMPDLACGAVLSALSEIKAKENVDFRLYVSKPENDGGALFL